MRNALLFPAAVALSAHALLLFGFRSPGAVASVSAQRPALLDNTMIIEPPVFPPEELIDLDSGADRAPEAAKSVPAQPEPLSPAQPGDISIPMPPMPPPRVDGPAVDRVPQHWLPNSDRDGTGIAGGGPLISPDLLDNPPRTKFQPAPQYPYSAKQSGLSGEVVVSFVVDERGIVRNAAVVRSTAREFEDPALRAVEKWRFQPGKRDGRPVHFRMAVPIVFNIDADA